MRKPRKYSKKGFYHTFSRGVNKQNIFYDDDDRNYFLDIVFKYADKYNIGIHTYVLMDNHFHLEFEDPDKNISKFMGLICSLYARFFNKKYDRTGHLFQERFGSECIEDIERLLDCCRYILRNPEAAGICKTEKYKWSSYKLYKKSKPRIRTSIILSQFNTIEKFYEFLEKENKSMFLDIEFRPSEKKKNIEKKIALIIGRDNPMIPPEWSLDKISISLKKLIAAGYSINTISRVTGVCKGLIRKII